MDSPSAADRSPAIDSSDVIYCGPETRPLFALSELLSWKEPRTDSPSTSPSDAANCYLIPKRTPRAVEVADSKGPMTLVCHDMKGGYLEDRYNDGHSNHHAYRFYHWSLVDIFVYFSHHFITIPPIGWTIAAHRNGVRSFGTVIIEHRPPEEGEEDEELAIIELLRDEDRIEEVASALARIAAFYRLDGWLMNMETSMPVEKIPLMEQLLRILTAKMKETLDVPEKEICVLWYDSVTADTGTLEWQNELNERNLAFFNACDGIFLNYTWTPDHLARSRAHLLECDLEETTRLNRIFVGIDVFGRGCLGGGGFFSNIAMSEIHKVNLSVAIFAPGWTYEMLGADNFSANEHTFWSKMVPYLQERALTKLPIRTNFCQGYGDRTFVDGILVANDPWYDLRRQQLQPCFHSHSVQICTKDAWQGGSCLKVAQPFHLPELTIFRCAIPLAKTKYHYSIVHKRSHGDALNVISAICLEGGVSGAPYQLDLDPLDTDVPVPYASLINRIDFSTEALAGKWVRDDFEVELFENTLSLIITSIKLSFRRSHPSEQAADATTIAGAYVLIGAVSFE